MFKLGDENELLYRKFKQLQMQLESLKFGNTNFLL